MKLAMHKQVICVDVGKIWHILALALQQKTLADSSESNIKQSIKLFEIDR